MFTPPTLTAADIKITNDLVITFTDPGDTWKDAITGITLNSDTLSSSYYTLASGIITIEAVVFKLADAEYTIVISATGYDDNSVSIDVDVCPWSELTLYETADITTLEPNLLKGLTDGENLHETVKQHLYDYMLTNYNRLQDLGEDYYGATFQLLDHLTNPIVAFQQAAIYKAIQLISEARTFNDEDMWFIKAGEYSRKYRDQIKRGGLRCRWDIDLAERRSSIVRFGW